MFFLQKLNSKHAPSGLADRNRVFLLYSPARHAAFMFREVKPLGSYFYSGCTLRFVRATSPKFGEVATLDEVEYFQPLGPVTERVRDRSMHVHGGGNFRHSEGCFLPVPYEKVGEMLATRLPVDFSRDESILLAKKWRDSAPFDIVVVAVAMASNEGLDDAQA